MAQKEGFYRVELINTVWEVPERYQNLMPVGNGAFGQVCSATDTESRSSDSCEVRVAIKKLARPFQSQIHAKRTYRELKMLKHMKHENIIELLDCFTSASTIDQFSEVYMVTPLMDLDLNNIIKIQKLTDDQVKFIIYQIMRGLKYIHSAGIIHRDLKPSNLAVNEDCDLKILDFGLARPTDAEMTGYVATRWYRAPEIMLNWMHYSQTVDIWSVGCIMAELLTGRPLFPGDDQIDQITKVLTICGTPTNETLSKITSEEAILYIRSLPRMEKKDFQTVFPGSNPQAIDLLEKMLEVDADKRITAAQTLSHPYLEEYADPTDEPTAPFYDQTFEDYELSVEVWKEKVWTTIKAFREEMFRERFTN